MLLPCKVSFAYAQSLGPNSVNIWAILFDHVFHQRDLLVGGPPCRYPSITCCPKGIACFSHIGFLSGQSRPWLQLWLHGGQVISSPAFPNHLPAILHPIGPST